MTGEDWRPRPIYLPDAHLPNSAEPVWTCRQCRTPWPCPTAEPYLTRGQCSTCGSPTYWDTNLPRQWHLGPRCYTAADALRAEAEELHQHHQRNPNYPPSHYYPDKPRRRRRQRPPYDHTPSRPGDIEPGTTLWVSPGGLHPGWGDIHHLAILTAHGRPKCEVWVWLDSTVHLVRPEYLILDISPIRNAARVAGVTTFRQQPGRPSPLLPEWQWIKWTVDRHLQHREQHAPPPPTTEAVQEPLFAS
ncbi:hypothetical protein [Streptomyces sp. NPDC048191]|uniref:hypothetical protein n=1 Tax=Streptomyces sp. NPDC048191 TaxID=3155484 RepID=UPI0033D987CE